MIDACMIMPMAGRGSRFAQQGEPLPKPMIRLGGKPFFYWATLSVLRQLPRARLVFVVLQEHVDGFGIDSQVNEYFPEAQVVAIPEVTSGSLETVLKVGALAGDGAVLVNDCDHAFSYSCLRRAVGALEQGADGFLSHFRSTTPHFSFAAYDVQGRLQRTVEKVAISDRAIAGLYGFRSMRAIEMAADSYVRNCPYPELFVSGLYNEIVAAGGEVRGFDLDSHVPFGTPEEYRDALLRVEELKRLEGPSK
ncbi:dolichyl-phosphate mannose synthase [Pseudoxanthomonas winnipegensis]|uniref:NTP transferase domain-containing protein n=1 Tax=Pseudoxanthomonas winnipegensis TaxID=2480810 RepID=UPI00102E025F|nr:NTP transferase domain-containing protein [Pseudoxanthomonas winnipegensis]TAA44345.1 dolichyl-phosphate mannose synthase [Pseudoxanthomonas winnipegensis]